MRCRIVALLVLGAFISGAVAGPEVTDDTGRQIALDEPARRIVSLAPHITEALYAAGAGEHVIAAVNHSDYPAAAEELPRVGTYDQLSVEEILGHEPELVIAWESGNPRDQVQRLRELGLTVYVTEPRSLDAIANTLLRLGSLAGTDERARQAADEYRQRLSELRERYADRPALEVFYQVWDDPLMTVNGDHVIADVIRGCGGRNVFAQLPAIAPRVSLEAVLEREPEVIIASGMGDARPDWLDMWREWPELPAAARGHLFFVPPDIVQRHAPRILEGMAQVCAQLQEARDERGRE